MKIASLPGSRAEALEALAKDSVVQAVLGEAIYEAFRRAKQEEWAEYQIKVTDWEVERYLELA